MPDQEKTTATLTGRAADRTDRLADRTDRLADRLSTRLPAGIRPSRAMRRSAQAVAKSYMVLVAMLLAFLVFLTVLVVIERFLFGLYGLGG